MGREGGLFEKRLAPCETPLASLSAQTKIGYVPVYRLISVDFSQFSLIVMT